MRSKLWNQKHKHRWFSVTIPDPITIASNSSSPLPFTPPPSATTSSTPSVDFDRTANTPFLLGALEQDPDGNSLTTWFAKAKDWNCGWRLGLWEEALVGKWWGVWEKVCSETVRKEELSIFFFFFMFWWRCDKLALECRVGERNVL